MSNDDIWVNTMEEEKQSKRKLSQAGLDVHSDSMGSEDEEEELMHMVISKEYFGEIVKAWCEKEGTKVLKSVLNPQVSKGKK